MEYFAIINDTSWFYRPGGDEKPNVITSTMAQFAPGRCGERTIG
ncbi:hypothetical protein D781_0619 [Serratia sp. FGI94]|nr:hypothetical protein D781_0619 [Serratia sp. FGI94]